MEQKRTQKSYFEEIRELLAELGRDELAEFIGTRIAVLDNKSANRKAKVSESDIALKETILSALTSEGVTVTQLMGKVQLPENTSNQKVTSILKALIEVDKLVTKEKSGKSMLYRLA
jgi:predicted transcriptional regulator